MWNLILMTAMYLLLAVQLSPAAESQVAVSKISHSGALITWTSDVPTTTYVEYGPTAAYGMVATTAATAPATALALNHFMGLGGLPASTDIHFRIRAVDASGQLSLSPDYTFTTNRIVATIPAPPVLMDTSVPRQSGAVRQVTPATCGTMPLGSCLQNAIDSAGLGDTILLASGETYNAAAGFRLRAKGVGSGWIVIQPIGTANVPVPGIRISPSATLPKITSSSGPVFTTEVDATNGPTHYYRLMGLEIAASQPNQTLIRIGSGTETTLSSLPEQIVIDRCYLHGTAPAPALKGVIANGKNIAVVDSYISDVRSAAYDSTGFNVWNGTGPFKVVNNHIEAASEAIMFGGAKAMIQDLVPSDVEIRQNHLYKPRSWNPADPSFAGTKYVTYNPVQLKGTRRAIVEGNVIENQWDFTNGDYADLWTGIAVVLEPGRSVSASPWDQVSDISVRSNIILNSPGGMIVGGWNRNVVSEQSTRIEIRNNLITGGDSNHSNIFVQNGTEDVAITHNTVDGMGDVLLMDETPNGGLIVANNIARHNVRGVFGCEARGIGWGCDAGSPSWTGAAALARYAPDYQFAGNVISGVPPNIVFPPGNSYPADWGGIGFVDPNTGNYTLAVGSLYRNGATDGSDPGIDMNVLTQRTNGVVQGNPQPIPEPISPPPAAGVTGLTLRSTAITGGTQVLATVSLASAAPSTGAVVMLFSDNPAGLPPVRVMVAAGVTTATFSIATTAVSVVTTADISATYAGTSQSAALTINPAALSGFALGPIAVVGGVSGKGTLTLTGPAPSGGIVVSLASADGTVAAVPAAVTVAAGSTTAIFTITTTGVSAVARVIITASYSGATKTATLTINPAALYSVSVSPASIAGGMNSTLKVSLNGAAPPAGAVVQLSTSDSSATSVPSTALVPPGSTFLTVLCQTSAVPQARTVTLTATYTGASKSASLTVNPIVLSTLSLSPASIAGGKTGTGNRVTLNGPAPTGGMAVQITSSTPAIGTVPASVTVPEGQTSATFSTATTAVASSSTLNITASAGGVTKTAPLTVIPPSLYRIALSPVSLTGGATSTANTVTLDVPAPAGGTVVSLVSSVPATVAVPITLTVPAGAVSAKFNMTTAAVVASTTVMISAQAAGVTKTAFLTINPIVVSSLSIPATITGGTTVTTAWLALTGAAPASGATVSLTSSQPGFAAVPDSIVVAAGGTKSPYFKVVTVPVTASTAVTISATYNGIVKTVTISVAPRASI